VSVIKIPFVNLLNIKLTDTLELNFTQKFTNHLGSMHAGALFTLAETQSGLFLQQSFSSYKNIIALLRSSQIKYKKEAKSSVKAFASASKESLEIFKNNFTKKGKGLIEVDVKLYSNNNLVAVAKFNWYVTSTI